VLSRFIALFRHPAQVLVVAFAGVIGLGAFALWLPISSDDPAGTSWIDALFTSTSAVCVTGLAVVDTGAHWSGFGTAVLLALIQVGGLGIVTLATMLTLLVSDRLNIDHLRTLSAEVGTSGMADLRHLVMVILSVTAVGEAIAATIMGLRLFVGYDYSAGDALVHGVFHAVSAWNNAGFGLEPDSLTKFVGDPVVTLALGGAIVAGGIGIPVLRDLGRHRLQARRWTLHTKLTVFATALLLVAGFFSFLVFEWTNAATMGPLAVGEKVNASVFQSITPRTAGFNSIDFGAVQEPTIMVTTALMFIGGGPASTAGGMKVTTFILLGFVMWAEIRGDPDVNAFRRRIPTATQRQALTVALSGIGFVTAGVMALLVTHDFPLVDTAFEAVSAIGTVGLSTGVTPFWDTEGKLVLVGLMFLGRLGPLTLATALVLRSSPTLYRYPEEQPLIG
jgi:potassium uptake TrkH family protein